MYVLHTGKVVIGIDPIAIGVAVYLDERGGQDEETASRTTL